MPDAQDVSVASNATSVASGPATGQSSTPSPPASPPSQQTPQSQPGTAQTPPSQAAPAAAVGAPQSLMDRAKALGFHSDQQFADEGAFLQHVVTQAREAEQARQQAQQAQQLAQYGQQVLPHWQQFQTYLQQQQAAAQQTPEKPWWSKFWSPPEYDSSWEQQIVRGADGKLSPAEGAPPDIVQKLLTYRQYRQQQAEKLMSNPMEYIKGPVEHLARQMAEEVVKQHMSGYQDQLFARSFAEQNTDWLYQRGADGQLVAQTITDPRTGMQRREPVLSQWGQAFRGYVLQAEQMGISQLQAQKDYALGMVQRDYLMSQQQTGVAGQQAANAAFLAQHQPNAGASTNGIPTPGTGVVQTPQNKSLSLADMMRAKFQQAGVTVDAA